MNKLALIGSEPVWTQDVHPDLDIVASGREHGNTLARFSSPEAASDARLRLMGQVGCKQMAAMAPEGKDSFTDLDALPHGSLQGDIVDVPGDGLITSNPDVALFLGAADCAPLVLYDPTEKVLGLAHIGRTGAVLGLAGQMLDYMQRERNINPEKVVAHFGPTIAPESYVLSYLGEDLQAADWQPFAYQSPNAQGYEIDFVGYTKSKLIEKGVPAANITETDVDVRTDRRHFSLTAHKEDGIDNGRNGFVVRLKHDV